ncbi:MAG: FkbM family methyltransferase [Bacteroidota bacterium]
MKKKATRFYDINVRKDEFKKTVYNWKDRQGDKTLRLDYPLDENSLVFDIGGYAGDFAADIFCKYNCNVYVFEPVSVFYEKIKTRFSNNSKVKVFNVGLSGESTSSTISINGTSSSLFKASDTMQGTQKIKLVSIADFIQEHGIEKIDLMKINIEGGEYPLLEALTENNLINFSRYYQIQFHNFISDAKVKREDIRTDLRKTHRLLWDYPFVWESWEKIAN